VNTANRIYLIIILSIASLLLFYNLDNQYLWQDEAETAVLARNVFKFGLPKAFDGKNTILLMELPDLSNNYFPGWVWMGQPWLGIYVTHLSFRAFGINTFAARLPFALFGLLSIFATYLTAQRLFKDRALSNIAVLLISFSVPFILHARQCRYYSLGILLMVLSLYLYLDYLEKKKFSELKLLIILFLLINTSISYFLSAITAIIAHLYFSDRRSFLSKRNIIFFLAALSYSAPILYLFKLPRRLSQFDVEWIFHNIKYYIRSINRYIFPWRAFIVLYLVYAVKKRRRCLPLSDNEKRPVLLLAFFILSAFPYLIFVNFNTLRYVIHLVPFLFILEAWIFSRLMRRFKYIAVLVVLPLALFTNVLSISKPVASYLSGYIYEITHDYDGPEEGIVKFLQKNAKPGDVVKIPHCADNATMFYTDLKVNNLPPFDGRTYPEWIIPRLEWNRSEFYDSDYYKEIKKRYDEITIPYPDIRWENRPDDMGYHKFKTDTLAPRIKIYRRRD